MELLQAKNLVDNYLYYVPVEKFAEGLCLATSTVRKRLANHSELKYDECFMLSSFFCLPLKLFFNAKDFPLTIPVDYFSFSKKRPNFKRYYADLEILYSYKRYINNKQFKIYMTESERLSTPKGYLYINAGEVALIDTSEKDLKKYGVYLYTCNNETYSNLAWIEENYDNTVSFTFTYPELKTEIRTWEQLESYGFKVHGRVIKNLNFFS